MNDRPTEPRMIGGSGDREIAVTDARGLFFGNGLVLSGLGATSLAVCVVSLASFSGDHAGRAWFGLVHRA